MRLDVVDAGRRRRWTDAEKQRIVEESCAGARLVSATARCDGISRSLLTTWRRLHRQGLLRGARGGAAGFATVTVAPDRPASPAVPTGALATDLCRTEIVLRNDRRIVLGAGMGPAALAQLIAVVERA